MFFSLFFCLISSSASSRMSSSDRAFVIAIIDCVSFIVGCPEAVDRVQRRSRTGEALDVAAHVDREHS